MVESQNSQNEEGSISLVELKEIAKRALSKNSTLRALILTEPDLLPREIGMAKIHVFVKLLYQELGL